MSVGGRVSKAGCKGGLLGNWGQGPNGRQRG